MLQLYPDFVGYKTNDITQLLYIRTLPAVNTSNDNNNNNNNNNNNDNNNKISKGGSSLNCIIELHQLHLAKSSCHFDFTQQATLKQLFRNVQQLQAAFQEFWGHL